MLGLDAADPDVIQDLVGQGRLPVLARLIGSGVFGRLKSPADLYAGGVWPTFYTGQAVPWHGIFHNKLWRPESMRVDVPSDEWIAARPFWESLAEADMEVCIVDVPMVLGQPRPVRGVYVGGWGTHDLICKGSWPTSLWRDLERRFGSPLMPKEQFGRQSLHSLAKLHDALVRSTEQMRDIAIHLLNSRRWDFACVVFGAIHRAGHYLWDKSQIEGATVTDPESGTPDPALVSIYEAVDAALGEVLEHCPNDARVVAFSVHGMGPNPGWSDLLPDILARVDEQRGKRAPKLGMLYAVKRRLPFHWARPVLTRLPTWATDRMVPLWSRHMFDWSDTRYFPVPMDEAGYIRINARGRETHGIVAPSAEYRELCTELEGLITSLCDAASGAPIVGPIERAYDQADSSAPARRLIPDLIVRWQGPSARAAKRLVSTKVPGFVYEVPTRLPSGRSGNHTNKGWFIARGPGVDPADLTMEHDVVDLLPTVLKYLGVEPWPQLQGRSIQFDSRR